MLQTVGVSHPLALACLAAFLHLLTAGGRTTSLKSVSSVSPTGLMAVRSFAKFCDARSGFFYYTGQSASTLKSEFQDIRNRFNGRYVRLYGACDRNGF